MEGLGLELAEAGPHVVGRAWVLEPSAAAAASQEAGTLDTRRSAPRQGLSTAPNSACHFAYELEFFLEMQLSV